MSKIDKLSILGVRSFDNTRSETIQFHSPLTLIVGLNGSGKTTIIECLKFATTGVLPPNSKSGAFIHDPKLCGEKEVLAQVKVAFRSTEGTRMVCTRNLQLTVKKALRSMKQLEGSLLIVRDGEKLTMSSRVAELNTMMPQYLGVSAAIIDSVIFCHQEESLWPLSEPAKLKQRFDEIFEALKYTKAIENIKVLQKNQKQSLIGFKKDEEYLKAEKDRADKMEKQSRQLHAEIDVLRGQSDEKSTQIKEAAKEHEQAWKKAEAAGLIVGELIGKRIEAKTKEESVQSLRQTLNEMSDSDDDLQRMLEQYEERVQAYEDDLSALKGRWQGLGQEIQTARETVSAKEREAGSYEEQKKRCDRQIQDREQLIKETARSHNIRGFDFDLDDQQVEAFMDRIAKMAKDQNAAFERARKETQAELNEVQKVLTQINEQKSALGQRKENCRQSIANNDSKVGNLQRELNTIDIDEGKLATMNLNLKERTSQLDQIKEEMKTADWQNSIERSETELRRLEEQKEKLDSELFESTRKASESARFDVIRSDLAQIRTALDTMVANHGDKIATVVGDGWSLSTLEVDFQRALEQKSAAVREAEKQIDGVAREKDQVDFQLNNCKTELKAKHKTLKAAETAIHDALQIKPPEYLEELNSLELSRDTLKGDEDSFKVINSYFDQCVKDARSATTCRTCTRKLKDKEVDVLLKNIEKARKSVTLDSNAKEELREVEESLEAARNVRSEYDDWERLNEKEIPALQREVESLEEKRARLVAQLEQHDEIVRERKDARKHVENLSRSVQTIVTDHGRISNFEMQIQDLTAKSSATGLSRAIGQIQEDVKQIGDQTNKLRTRLKQTVTERDRKIALSSKLELDIRDVQGTINAAQYQLKNQQSLESQIKEYEGFNVEQRTNIKSIDQELQTLGQRLSQSQIKYDDIATRGGETDRELRTVADKLNESVNRLRLANQDITAYHTRGGPEQLVRSRREVEDSKAGVIRIERDQSELVREIKGLEDQLRNHGDTKRSIADNQRYRRDLRQLQRVRSEIEELETHDAEEDKARWQRESNRWQMERNKLAAEQATIVGSLKSKDAQLDQSLKDWETDYRDAGKKYKEAHIKAETTKACIEDLGRYGGALDQAIMKYHSIKMEEINRIVDELWRKTYQGTDVDTILIRSESENTKSNKSYNYRVCMVKQDAEMDMRGRCSAGQKVLASILIRLALAECFGTRCGLIALDEPTTNLDRDNIRALAQSLAEIIRLRRAQPNFQLIVITHDEDFLRYMNCSDFADVYWRVGRNDKQKSQIERQSIAEVI